MSAFGFIPKEINASYVTAEKIQGKQSCEIHVLDVADETAAGNNVTSTALVDAKEPNLVHNIPKGAIIEEVCIKVNDAAALDPKLEFCLGFFSNAVTAEASVALLSQRIFADDARVTAKMLSDYGCLHVSEELKGDKIVFMNKVLGKEEKNVLAPHVTVGEPVELQPNITVTKGKLLPGVISIIFKFKY